MFWKNSQISKIREDENLNEFRRNFADRRENLSDFCYISDLPKFVSRDCDDWRLISMLLKFVSSSNWGAQKIESGTSVHESALLIRLASKLSGFLEKC
jgi:hypothetical protein